MNAACMHPSLLAGSTMTTALDIYGGTTKIVLWANEDLNGRYFFVSGN